MKVDVTRDRNRNMTINRRVHINVKKHMNIKKAYQYTCGKCKH